MHHLPSLATGQQWFSREEINEFCEFYEYDKVSNIIVNQQLKPRICEQTNR